MQIGPTFLRFCEGLDTPVSLSCWLLFKYGQHRELSEKTVRPQDYADADSFSRDYACVKLLSKYKGLKTGINTERVALDKWELVESKMLEANRRLQGCSRGFSPGVEAVMFTAKRKIASCLGPFDLSQALESCKWGPGATFTLKGEDATMADKLLEKQISVTHAALPYLMYVLSEDVHWMRSRLGLHVEGPTMPLWTEFSIVHGNRMTTVDKDAKTDRVIAIEPTGNVFLQLGLGSVLRSRLRRRGVFLDDQSINQKLAKLSSVSDDLATIDLSSASDSVSRETVWSLLPFDWASYMDDLRSKETLYKGKWLTLQKFSSMGNGFTFELETLIFWGLANAVCEVLGVSGEVAVYGDDIILPVQCVSLLTEVLTVLGFSLNKEKSYDRGYFRESCGSHYWNGIDVTPVYQREELTSLPEIYRFANRILSLSHRLSGGSCFSSSLKRAWERVILDCPFEIQHFVPWGDDSDDGLKLPLGSLLSVIADYDSLGTRIKLPILAFRGHRRKADDSALLAYYLRFHPDTPFNGKVSVRRRGHYVPRRRWFYTFAHNDLSTLDVAWG